VRYVVLLLSTLVVAALTLACGDKGAQTATVPAGTVSADATQPATSAETAPAQPTSVPTSAQPTTTPTSAPEPTATRPPAPTQPPAPQPTAPPVQSGPVTIAVSARNLAFDRASISVPRNSTVTVNFTNNDALVAHDFGVSIPFVPHTETCSGPCQASITFNSGPPGAYTFQCSIHADMVGTFTVQ
jgi:plastocyanin